MVNYLQRLPQDILIFLKDYLRLVEDQNEMIFRFSSDWRNFMNTSNEYFGKWKKESQIVHLPYDMALKFFTSAAFRDAVLSRIQKGKVQLCVDAAPCEISCSDLIRTDFKYVSIYISVDTWLCPAVFRSVDTFRLSFSNVARGLSDLKDIRSLTLSCNGSDSVLNLEGFNVLEELSCNSLTIENIHLARNLRKAEFSVCRGITTLKGLRNLSSLRMDQDDPIPSDLPVAQLKELILEEPIGLASTSHFGVIPHLSLISVDIVIDLPSLCRVIVLDISRNLSVTDIRCLRDSAIRELNISECYSITDITMLHKVQKLLMDHCSNIRDFTGLVALKELRRSDSNKLLIQSGLETFSQLTSFTSDDTVENLFCLEKRAREGEQLGDLSPTTSNGNIFRKLQKLTVHNLQPSSNHFSGFSALGELVILSCWTMVNFTIEGNHQTTSRLYYVEFANCPRLKEIRVISRIVSVMKIRYCGKVNIEGKENILSLFGHDKFL